MLIIFAAVAHGLIIFDAEADMKDLEVGDMNDELSDLPPTVRQEILNLKQSRELLDGVVPPTTFENAAEAFGAEQQRRIDAASGGKQGKSRAVSDDVDSTWSG